MVPHANWHHPTSDHTKYSTYQQHCTGSKFSFWEMKMTTKLVEFGFFLSPVCLLGPLNAEVLVVVVVVGCMQGSWSQVSTFSCYSHCLPLAQHACNVRGYQNNFQEPVLWYRLSMFCQNCVTCPSIRTDPGIPPPGYSAAPRTRVYGPAIRTHAGAGDTVWQTILNLYNNISALGQIMAWRRPGDKLLSEFSRNSKFSITENAS